MDYKIQLLFSLLRSAICAGRLSEDEMEACDSETVKDIICLARGHDINHLIIYALQQNDIAMESENDVIMAICRYEKQNHDYIHICNAFEASKIDFLPLKGSIIRKYYPSPWMRTSCDIDILVKEEDLERATSLLLNDLNYRGGEKNTHDVSFFSPGNTHLELHYDLIEEWFFDSVADVLKTVWSTSHKCEGYNHRYEMSDEMFYYYHIAHMAKHFENGGCGIRPIMDLWILENINKANKGKRDELLKAGGLLQFSDSINRLSKVWFANSPHTDITMKMESYILTGGVYGTMKNRIVVQQQKKGGKLPYLISRIFLPCDILKFQYPILQKHRFLTPIMQVCRWFRIIFCGRARRVIKEISYNNKISNDEAADIQMLLNSIGL